MTTDHKPYDSGVMGPNTPKGSPIRTPKHYPAK